MSNTYKDNHQLTLNAEKIKQRLERLEWEFWMSDGHQGGEDSVDLMEDLKEVEVDVSLMLTDYISAGCTLGEDTPKVVFHDFRGIFGSLDTLLNGLKKARGELAKAYAQEGAVVDRSQIDYGRFRNLLEQIESHLNGNRYQIALSSAGNQAHKVHDYAITL